MCGISSCSLDRAFSALFFGNFFVSFLLLFHNIHSNTEAIFLLCRLIVKETWVLFFFRNTVLNLHIVLVQGNPLDFCVSDISCSLLISNDPPHFPPHTPLSYDSPLLLPLPGFCFQALNLCRWGLILLKNTTAFFLLKKITSGNLCNYWIVREKKMYGQ